MPLPVEDHVKDRQDLAAYVQALRGEFLRRGSEWENQTLGSFLHALAACLTDHNGGWGLQDHMSGQTQPAEWGYFAFVLGAATVYE